MPMHYWGEEGFNFCEVSEAAEYIGEGLRKWGRANVTQYKEKFGQVRVYCYLGLSMFHQLIWPGYCRSMYPYHWMWVLDIKLSKLWKYISFIIVTPYHVWLYRKLYKNAVKKWPHLHDEIVACADYTSLLKDL